MPSRHTFSVKPIGDFVRRYLAESRISIDPFCGEKRWATHCNDLERDRVDAEEFLKMLAVQPVHDAGKFGKFNLKGKADLLIFDPPYSPRQIAECYKSVGLEVGMKETQSALLYKRVRDASMPLLSADATVLSFGWSTVGMGSGRGFEILEIMLCCHGGAHNDTICLAERRLPSA